MLVDELAETKIVCQACDAKRHDFALHIPVALKKEKI